MSQDAFLSVAMHVFMAFALALKNVNANLDLGVLLVMSLVQLENMDPSVREIVFAKIKHYVILLLEAVPANLDGKAPTAAYPVILISMVTIVNRNADVKMGLLVIPYLELVNVRQDTEVLYAQNLVQKGHMVNRVPTNVSVKMEERVIM